MIERTFVMVKPDGVGRRFIGEVIGRYEAKGLKLVGLKMQIVSRALAETHYAEHRGQPFYAGLIEFITSGPTVQMVWEGEDLYGTFTLTMTIEVTQSIKVWKFDEEKVLDKDAVPLYYQDSYLDDEWRIIVNDPEIEALREDIVGNETNVYLIAKAIYDWIDENVDYYMQQIAAHRRR